MTLNRNLDCEYKIIKNENVKNPRIQKNSWWVCLRGYWFIIKPFSWLISIRIVVICSNETWEWLIWYFLGLLHLEMMLFLKLTVFFLSFLSIWFIRFWKMFKNVHYKTVGDIWTDKQLRTSKTMWLEWSILPTRDKK